MSALQESCAELARWLPAAQALIAEPDSDGTRTRTAPTSRPPWNGAVANAVTDAAALARDLEMRLYVQVTGRPRLHRRGGSDGNTFKALGTIAAFASSIDAHDAAAYAAELRRPASAIKQLPAVDEEERPRVLKGDHCPYCLDAGRPGRMIWLWPRSYRVACINGAGICTDWDGRPPTGRMDMNQITGDGIIVWDDGRVTP